MCGEGGGGRIVCYRAATWQWGLREAAPHERGCGWGRYSEVEQQYKIRLRYQERGHVGEEEGRHETHEGKSHLGHLSPTSADATWRKVEESSWQTAPGLLTCSYSPTIIVKSSHWATPVETQA